MENVVQGEVQCRTTDPRGGRLRNELRLHVLGLVREQLPVVRVSKQLLQSIYDDSDGVFQAVRVVIPFREMDSFLVDKFEVAVECLTLCG